jgi:hypothetical protein
MMIECVVGAVVGIAVGVGIGVMAAFRTSSRESRREREELDMISHEEARKRYKTADIKHER